MSDVREEDLSGNGAEALTDDLQVATDDQAKAPPGKPLCFAIMPITMPPEHMDRYGNDAQHFPRVAEYIFKPAAEQAGFEFKAPTSTSIEIIQAEIIKNLEHADLVLCDISTWNANVFFELGIRVALDRPVAMVRDNHTGHIPFDTTMLNFHTYDCNLGVFAVKDEIPRLRTFLEQCTSSTDNAMWRYFGITQRASRTDPGNPEDAKLDLILAELAALRTEAAFIPSSQTSSPQSRVSCDRLEQSFELSTSLANEELLLRNVREKLNGIGVTFETARVIRSNQHGRWTLGLGGGNVKGKVPTDRQKEGILGSLMPSFPGLEGIEYGP